MKKIFQWFLDKVFSERKNLGEKALQEVAEMVSRTSYNRERLIKNGWKIVVNPPLVGNEMIWEHPQWRVQLESKAIKILDLEGKK